MQSGIGVSSAAFCMRFPPYLENDMNKLALNADDLRVDSFPTAAQPAERGTVDAHMATNGANTCYCTSVNIGCWCTERATCAHCD